ncbi:unknown similar to AMEV237 [Mythimna separata entomopoxvirus 'L']|uniref:Uncharacterized protein n=1 Tax=Mythimna separata entomopoxvirus 'L' TaxID=1293572 RepID=A0A916KQF1_9POXV|nr:unknown similar to AMEV237 [Mythimna separata entomopoxvirus 'L']CCU56461.1 unknown similar to AMEV237 [Mythimna separata entomopoxvirus 'L']
MENETYISEDLDIEDEKYNEILQNLNDEKNEMNKKQYTEGLLRLIFGNMDKFKSNCNEFLEITTHLDDKTTVTEEDDKKEEEKDEEKEENK